MRWSWVLFFFLLLPSVSALSLDCPPSAYQNEQFSITVSHAGATQVKLYHHGNWETKSGQSATFTISQNSAGFYDYYGGAYANGAWIEGSSYFCTVQVIQYVNNPGDVDLTTSTSTVTTGSKVSITVDFNDADGTDSIELWYGSQFVDATSCSTTVCQRTFEHTPQTNGRYRALGKDSALSITEGYSSYITVTNPSPIISNFVVTPLSVAAGDTISVSGTVSDNNLQSVNIYYKNSSHTMHTTMSCTSTSCSISATKTLSVSGTYEVYAVATDALGQSTTSDKRYVSVSSPIIQDMDADGISDATDQCPNTAAADRPVVTSGSYLGCSCNQIVNKIPNPTDDGKVCTDDLCTISNGAFVKTNPPESRWEPASRLHRCLPRHDVR